MKKILVIRFSSIGDIVLTTPVVRCLKDQAGIAEVHYLTKQQFEPVLKANPFVDRIYSIKNRVGEVIRQLKAERYDHIIDLHKNFRSREVCLRLKAPCTTFSKINFRKWV